VHQISIWGAGNGILAMVLAIVIVIGATVTEAMLTTIEMAMALSIILSTLAIVSEAMLTTIEMTKV
jgi:hypothetical protein